MCTYMYLHLETDCCGLVYRKIFTQFFFEFNFRLRLASRCSLPSWDLDHLNAQIRGVLALDREVGEMRPLGGLIDASMPF